jgi:hypothetical protein
MAIEVPMDNRELILADCSYSLPPVEVHSIESQKHRFMADESLIDQTKAAMEESLGWLPFFAELYNVSSNLKDYILIPVVAMPSDLPNKNLQGFPYEELVRPDPDSGLLGFESWRRKSCFQDHQNDPSKGHKSKGVIFSTSMTPIKKTVGNLWKVSFLSGFDRRADPILANDILTGKRNSYSMGAWTRYFTCSVCKAVHTSKIQGCEHISTKAIKINIQPDGSLPFLQARYINGFENSSVIKPAYFTSVTDPTKHLV